MKDGAVIGLGTYAVAEPGMQGLAVWGRGSASLSAATPGQVFVLRSHAVGPGVSISVDTKVVGAEKSSQLAYIAVNRRGEVGGASKRRGFQFAVYKWRCK